MRSTHELMQRVRSGLLLFHEFEYVFHAAAYFAGGRCRILVLRRLLARNNAQEHGIGVVDVKSAGFGVLLDLFRVEQYVRILFQNAGMLPFELRSNAAQDRDRKALRPAMLQQLQSC